MSAHVKPGVAVNKHNFMHFSEDSNNCWKNCMKKKTN